MRDFEYFEPATIDEAISLLAKYGKRAKVLAGGTDLLVTMKQGVVNPDYLVNIKKIAGMSYIVYDEKEGLRIGALSTLREVASTPLVQNRFSVLAQAARQVGAPRIRNMGTIGGNLCQDAKCLYYPWAQLWHRPPCYRAGGNVCYLVKGAKGCQAMATSETAPALIALQARAKIVGPEGARVMPLESFFVEAGVTAIREDEVLLAIEVPNLPPHTSGVYLKHSARGAIDFAIVGAAVVLTFEASDDFCSDAKIVLLGVSRTPTRARKAEGMIKGKKIENNLIDQVSQTASREAHPISDIYGSVTYRRRVTDHLVKRAIRQALDAAKKSNFSTR